MSEAVSFDDSVALGSFSASGTAADEDDAGRLEKVLLKDFGDHFEDDRRTRLSNDATQLPLLLKVLENGPGHFVECGESLLDGLLVVVDAAGCFPSIEEALRHRVVRHFQVQHHLTRAHLFFEKDGLGDLSGISVKEKSFGVGNPLQHRFFDQIQNDL